MQTQYRDLILIAIHPHINFSNIRKLLSNLNNNNSILCVCVCRFSWKIFIINVDRNKERKSFLIAFTDNVILSTLYHSLWSHYFVLSFSLPRLTQPTEVSTWAKREQAERKIQFLRSHISNFCCLIIYLSPSSSSSL